MTTSTGSVVTRHRCDGLLPTGNSHGPAIEECRDDAAGRFWVSNSEYTSQVAFCPYCGTKATEAPSCGFHRESGKMRCTKPPGHAGDHDLEEYG